MGSAIKNTPKRAQAGTFCCTALGVFSRGVSRADTSRKLIIGRGFHFISMSGSGMEESMGAMGPEASASASRIFRGRSSERAAAFSSTSMPTIIS